MRRSRLLVSGGLGFIGSHICRAALVRGYEVVVLEGLNYPASAKRLAGVSYVFHDLRAPIPPHVALELGNVDFIIHTSAETHVDNSLVDPVRFVHTNVLGTTHLLEYARQRRLVRYIQLSTDEVFGSPRGPGAKEWDVHRPSNPYAASKAAADDMVMAYAHCFGLPACVLHSMNCFGDAQHPEKFIPSTIRKVLAGETVVLHGVPSELSRRKWLSAEMLADALLFLLTEGQREEQYNIEGVEADVLQVALFIASVLKKELRYEIADYHGVRPGHDLFYNLTDSKLRHMGWAGYDKWPFWDTLRTVIERSTSNE